MRKAGSEPGFLRAAVERLLDTGDAAFQRELEGRVEALVASRGFQHDWGDDLEPSGDPRAVHENGRYVKFENEGLLPPFPQTAQSAVEMLIIQNSQSANLFAHEALAGRLRAP